jgi:hypothetical protein
MAIPRFFKIPRHKTFHYQPIFYNPDKEDRSARIKEIKREMGIKEENEGGAYKTTIQRGAMRNYFHKTEKVRRQSNIRLVIIIVILLFVAYLILFY